MDATDAGALNAALANAIVKVVADVTGRGATRSRAFVDGDVVVCVLEDGATRAEQTLIEAGQSDLVRIQRDALQRLMEPMLVGCVEHVTGRSVRTFISGTSFQGDTSTEVFLLQPRR